MLALTKDEKSTLTILNAKHTSVVTLTQGAAGGGGNGMFQLSNAAGDPRVESGVNGNDLGVVRAGPQYNCAGKMGLVAPDCIVGHR